jgi:hypothetical protein
MADEGFAVRLFKWQPDAWKVTRMHLTKPDLAMTADDLLRIFVLLPNGDISSELTYGRDSQTG